jgi:hypothetical protein
MTAAHESQRVDLFVTRQWVRLILWEYATRHFPMASHAQDLAFSLYLPVSVSHELLGHLSSVSTDGSIRPHGFSMVCHFPLSLLLLSGPGSRGEDKC